MPVDPRRALGPVVAWVAAAVVAVALASWGVALVGRSVTDSRPAPLSAAQVDDRLAAATSTTQAGASAADPSTSTSATTGITAPGGAPSTTSTPPAGPSTTVESTPPPTTVAPPPPPAPAGETRTYQTVGGTASLRFEPAGVTVVFANPAPGFEVEVQPEHGNGVRVEFERDDHESRIDGWWDGGPRDQVDERPDHGDDD